MKRGYENQLLEIKFKNEMNLFRDRTYLTSYSGKIHRLIEKIQWDFFLIRFSTWMWKLRSNEGLALNFIVDFSVYNVNNQSSITL